MEKEYDDEYDYVHKKPSIMMPLVASSIVTGLIGAMISFITNCTLAEISTNAFFSLYFGMFFIVVGFIVLHRACFSPFNKLQLFIFGFAIVLSGII